MTTISTPSTTTNTPSATAAPAEVIQIDPESLEIANCYLQFSDIRKVADILDIGPSVVAATLKRREVKAYVDAVFKDLGYNNRVKMRQLMDTIINKKLSDMNEADIGSNKDILDILTLSHKMTMEHYAKEIELEKIRADNAAATKSQVNVQINNETGTNYSSLLERLLEEKNVNNQPE